MSQAEDLLNGLGQDDIALYIANPEEEPHIIIGEDRVVTVPDELKRIAVQFDHNIETVTFDCPRYWDGHDMSEMAVFVNYMRTDSFVGSYPCTNISVDETNSNIMHFDWTISNEVTMLDGKISFLVCVMNADEDGKLVNHWNSELSQDMYISKGLESSTPVLDMYPELITQLLIRLNLINKIEPLTYVDDGNGNVEIKGIGFPENIAKLYSNKMLYEVGDYCVYLGVLHKCTFPVAEPEEWNQSKWTLVTIADEMKECFTNVDDGKAAVASAITDMNVPTDATDTFEQMANNIRLIKTGRGNAQPEDVKEGVTFTNESGELLVGTSTAAKDLVILQSSYDTLEEEKNNLKSNYDTLEKEKNELSEQYTNLQNDHSEYVNAVVNGLANSGLDVSTETSAEELIALLQKEYPEPFIVYDTGTLAEGLTLVGFTNDTTKGYLHATSEASCNSKDNRTVKIEGINLTGHNNIMIHMTYGKMISYGTADLKYGIDTASTVDPYMINKTHTNDITIDVSEYSDTHSLVFNLYTENNSGDESYAASIDVKISKIELV